MYKRVIAWLAGVLMVIGMIFASTAPAQAGVYTKALNQCYSEHRVLVASGLGGGGTRSYVNPCSYSPGSVGSVYIYYTKSTSDWVTQINGNQFTRQGWVNVGHYINTKKISVVPWTIRY